MRITRDDLQAGKTYSYSELREWFDPCTCPDYDAEDNSFICYWHRRLKGISQEDLWALQTELWSDTVSFYLDWRLRREAGEEAAHSPNHDYMYALHYSRYFAARKIVITA